MNEVLNLNASTYLCTRRESILQHAPLTPVLVIREAKIQFALDISLSLWPELNHARCEAR